MSPELIVLGFLMMGLTLYFLLGGADFGAGVWEFNTALQAPQKERLLIYHAIAPVWEVNHVWLIFVLTLFHTAFPSAFAALCRALWIPFILVLVGIIFRGAGFAFRSYDPEAERRRSGWGAVFALASTAAPFFLGASVGAVAEGELLSISGAGAKAYLTGWISSFSIFNGFFSVSVSAYLSAVYLTREASLMGDLDLLKTWRERALGTGMWTCVLAIAGLAVTATEAPHLWKGLSTKAWPLVGGFVIGGGISLWALWRGYVTIAVLGAGSAITAILWGWGVAQYPVLIPPDITIQSSKAPDSVLWVLVWSLLIGGIFLLPSLGWLFYLFKIRRSSFVDRR